jgi:hypothetical protein
MSSNTLKSPSEMLFAEFANAISPSGAVNRFPSVGFRDVFSYSVYMNGPLATQLQPGSIENTFTDVVLHPLTEKLKLNPAAARDNLKVAEVVAIRSAWMLAVAKQMNEKPLSPEVLADYEKLSRGLAHPWIKEQIVQQRALMSKLQPALAMANISKDSNPHEVTHGKIISQDLDFTFQRATDGEVVTHENGRLASLPAVEEVVSIIYYRGVGQIVNAVEKLQTSEPFVDESSRDMAMFVTDGDKPSRLVLFNSMKSLDNFISFHRLDKDLMNVAMDARATTPKVAPLVTKEAVGMPYIDTKTGFIAVDYKETGLVYSALFRSANEVAELAAEFNFGTKIISTAMALENLASVKNVDDELKTSKKNNYDDDILKQVAALGYKSTSEPVHGQTYVGKVIAESAFYVAQHIGRGNVIVHDICSLNKLPSVGDMMNVKFESGRAAVKLDKSETNEVGR